MYFNALHSAQDCHVFVTLYNLLMKLHVVIKGPWLIQDCYRSLHSRLTEIFVVFAGPETPPTKAVRDRRLQRLLGYTVWNVGKTSCKPDPGQTLVPCSFCWAIILFSVHHSVKLYISSWYEISSSLIIRSMFSPWLWLQSRVSYFRPSDKLSLVTDCFYIVTHYCTSYI